MIVLGDKVKDIITEFEGIATARAEYLNGCVQYLLQPKYDKKNNKIPEPEWIDEQQLKVINPKPKQQTTSTGGGVRIHP